MPQEAYTDIANKSQQKKWTKGNVTADRKTFWLGICALWSGVLKH